ncbi:MAG: VIT1/CCC1 transporter family protein [Patescibacteria group bacterium]
MSPLRRNSLFVRNTIFGIEDSLAATVGLLSGLAAENISHEVLLLTGFVYISVEAFSMGIGSFLSEESAQEYEGVPTTNLHTLLGSLAMFASCIIAGLVPIVPYFFLEDEQALFGSIALSLIVLAALGVVQARLSGRSVLPRVLRMVLLGGAAIFVGVLVGKAFGLS